MENRRPISIASSLLTLAVLLLAGCATEHPFVWAGDLPASDDGRLLIAARDSILVVIQNQPAMSGEFVVHDDGAYLQPNVGNLRVEGRSPTEVAAELQVRLKELVVNPQVTVSITRVAPVKISVVGEVRTPGSYELTRDRSVIAALAAAGWLTDYAARDRIFVVRAAAGEPRVRFHARELTAAEPHSARLRLRDGDAVVVE